MRLYKITEKGELIKLDRLSFDENDVYLVDDEKKNTIYIWVGLKVPQEKKDITADIARKLDKERGGSTKILIMKEKREYGSFLAMMHNLEKGLIPGETIERRPEFVFEVPPERIETVKLDGTPEEREIKAETRIIKWFQQIKEHRKSEVKQEIEETQKAVKFVRIERTPADLETTDTILVKKITPKKEVIKEVEEPDFKSQIREAAYYLSLDKYSYNDLCWMLSEKIQKMSLEIPSIEDIKRKAEEVFRSSCSYDELCWLNAEMDLLIRKSYLEEKKKKSYF
ncbi:MAG: hypothetical protein ACFFG0_10100 [Candidatus Thorarchaeota archaeon]